MGGHPIFLDRVNFHPASRRLNELRFARRIEVVASSRRPLRRRQIAPMLAAILLAVPAVYAQTRSQVAPIRIAAGESVTLERAAAKGDDVFELRAKAGQTLVLEENGYWPAAVRADPTDVPGVRVFLADSSHTKDVEGSRGCLDWRWIGVLPTSVVYHIVVSRRSEKRYRLRVSLLGPHDPIFDPGITADRISIGAGLFPPETKLTLKAFHPADYTDYCSPLPLDGDLPAHLCLEDKHAWLGIMSVEGLKKANPTWVMEGDLAELERIVPYALPLKPLFSGYDDAPLAHWGRLEYFEAKSWRGLRWLAEYYPENDGLHNPLMYFFAAISADRKYFIWFRADINYLNAPPELSELTGEQRARLDDPTTYETFQSKVKIALTNASPKSFKPGLDELDAFVRSLELRW